MKLEITVQTESKQAIEIEFPYYYEYDLMLDESDSVIYGKIEENKHTSIQISTSLRNNSSSFELEINNEHASVYGCYMADKFKSNESEYLLAKAKLLASAQVA